MASPDKKKKRHSKRLSLHNLLNIVFPQKINSPSPLSRIPANYLTHEQKREKCTELFKLVSNSYRRMISKLDTDMNIVMSIYYMLLRGMDTIEDDMTIPVEKKIPLLRNFHKLIQQRGWTFTKNGPNEKHRQLLVEFDVVIEEFLSFSPEIQDIFVDVAKDMGNGMADYILLQEKSKYHVITIEDYDRYCFHVCSVFCLGFGRIMNTLNPELPDTDENYYLIKDVSFFIQKLDIIKDFREDFLQNRVYWPRAIWGQYVNDVSEILDPNKKEKALNCLSAMTFNALSHLINSLEFLSKIDDPVVFEIIALSIAVEFAYLTSIFRNHEVFIKHMTYQGINEVKSQCKNLRDICILFKSNVKTIMKKNDIKDFRNYLKINKSCKKIEQWCDRYLSKQQNQYVAV
ncbi:hypothetical protein Glove_99g290 [Diversispora epigaea]|uniref:Squalene synthase n=1 Tax=Diversispora epigaea TaxID=1348612 RepID=A0A397JF29_9GLOM|nr:hypothetical protein Glove_99g290 [Diversispora epigaea]